MKQPFADETFDAVTSIYTHILDEDRKVNAQKFESAFYSNPDLRDVRPPAEPKETVPVNLDLASLVEQLQKSPERTGTRFVDFCANRRQIGVKNQISKLQLFLSKLPKIVQIQISRYSSCSA